LSPTVYPLTDSFRYINRPTSCTESPSSIPIGVAGPSLLSRSTVTALQSSPPIGLRFVASQPSETPSVLPVSHSIDNPLDQTERFILHEQRRQISELQAQVQSYRQRCFGYRTRAATFKALYAQQHLLLEQTMTSLVHLQQSQELRHPPASR
jgi:hypothetical protein